MTIPFIPFAEGEALMNWLDLTDALARGHDLPKRPLPLRAGAGPAFHGHLERHADHLRLPRLLP